jgi:very-short-patch-repair endonuclease
MKSQEGNDANILKTFARQLRSDMTPYERIVWQKIRCKQIHGIQFYRQKPIGTFIIDFYAKSIRLAVEIDGGQHYTDEGRSRDIARDEYLHSQGVTILRFGNHEVCEQLNEVLEKIASTVLNLLSKTFFRFQPPPARLQT